MIDDPAHCPEEATVTFSVDGGSEQGHDCMLKLDEDGSCSCVVFLAAETEGTFDIVAWSADGARQGSQTVDVDDGACHVELTAVTIHLE